MQLTRRPSVGKPVIVNVDLSAAFDSSVDDAAAGAAFASPPRPRNKTPGVVGNRRPPSKQRAPPDHHHDVSRRPKTSWLLLLRLARRCILVCLSLALCYNFTRSNSRLDSWRIRPNEVVAVTSSGKRALLSTSASAANAAPKHHHHQPINRTLIINLARRTDRWRRISAHLARENLAPFLGTVERIEAIDGMYSLSDFAVMVAEGRLRHRAYESVKSSSQRRVWGHELTPGAVGCLLSHAKAWKRAVALNENILVLEDDVEMLSPRFEQTFFHAINDLPGSFGLLYLGDMAKDTRTIIKTRYSPNLLRLSRPLWGTYAYVVSPRAARRLLVHMYPADVQTDSYVQQVAELYAKDMPNFAIAPHDLVFTDNSDTRDTDVQTVGVEDSLAVAPSTSSSLLGRRRCQPLEYHALLRPSHPPPAAGSPAPAVSLSFDPTYFAGKSSLSPSSASSSPSSSPHHHQPSVTYHDPETAYQYALEQKIITRYDQNIPERIVRWLLCTAALIKHGGGLCFTDAFLLVRSIEHLLAEDVKIGVFMAARPITCSSASGPLGDGKHANDILTNVVYVSPNLAKADVDAFTLAVRHALYHHDDDNETTTSTPYPSTQEFVDNLVESIRSTPYLATLLPPHIFDPLIPLTRRCRCGRDDLQALLSFGRETTSTVLVDCQSRCDRLVAPPLAAGKTAGADAVHGTTNESTNNHGLFARPKPNWLHLLEASPLDAEEPFSEQRDRVHVSRNLGAWKRMHPSPNWTVVPLKAHQSIDHHRSRNHSSIRSFCRGVAAVATDGGVYVDARWGPPGRELGRWTGLGGEAVESDTDSPPTGVDAASPVTLVLQSPLKGDREPSARHVSTSDQQRMLSPSFFAAPYPNHPVAKRMAGACEHLLSWAPHDVPSANLNLQLQQILADDACAVRFVSEDAVFSALD